jgi:hypothetical protein
MKPMRGGAILIGLTAFGAYSVGRQSAPVSNAPVPAITSPSTLAQPVVFIDPAAQLPAPSRAKRLQRSDAEEWQAAMEALLLVAEHDGPTMFSRIGFMRALNRHIERVFDTSRKEHHWGRRKLARDQ